MCNAIHNILGGEKSNMSKYSLAQVAAMGPKEFRGIIRKAEWAEPTIMACRNYGQANLVIVPKEYAFEFLLFCNRNPRPCPVIDVTEPGDSHPRLISPDADLRTDLPKYRVFQDGKLVDEPTDIIKYWRDDLVGFLLGCSCGFKWAIWAAGISFRRYGGYLTNIPCIPGGRFHGHIVCSVRAFYNAHDAMRAVQISSRHLLMHGPPIHIGNPEDIGIESLGKGGSFVHPDAPAAEAPKPGEIVMYWPSGITAQTVAMETKIPFMITHKGGHMFVMDQLVEELAVM